MMLPFLFLISFFIQYGTVEASHQPPDALIFSETVEQSTKIKYELLSHILEQSMLFMLGNNLPGAIHYLGVAQEKFHQTLSSNTDIRLPDYFTEITNIKNEATFNTYLNNKKENDSLQGIYETIIKMNDTADIEIKTSLDQKTFQEYILTLLDIKITYESNIAILKKLEMAKNKTKNNDVKYLIHLNTIVYFFVEIKNNSNVSTWNFIIESLIKKYNIDAINIIPESPKYYWVKKTSKYYRNKVLSILNFLIKIIGKYYEETISFADLLTWDSYLIETIIHKAGMQRAVHNHVTTEILKYHFLIIENIISQMKNFNENNIDFLPYIADLIKVLPKKSLITQCLDQENKNYITMSEIFPSIFLTKHHSENWYLIQQKILSTDINQYQTKITSDDQLMKNKIYNTILHQLDLLKPIIASALQNNKIENIQPCHNKQKPKRLTEDEINKFGNALDKSTITQYRLICLILNNIMKLTLQHESEKAILYLSIVKHIMQVSQNINIPVDKFFFPLFYANRQNVIDTYNKILRNFKHINGFTDDAGEIFFQTLYYKICMLNESPIDISRIKQFTPEEFNDYFFRLLKIKANVEKKLDEIIHFQISSQKSKKTVKFIYIPYIHIFQFLETIMNHYAKITDTISPISKIIKQDSYYQYYKQNRLSPYEYISLSYYNNICDRNYYRYSLTSIDNIILTFLIRAIGNYYGKPNLDFIDFATATNPVLQEILDKSIEHRRQYGEKNKKILEQQIGVNAFIQENSQKLISQGLDPQQYIENIKQIMVEQNNSTKTADNNTGDTHKTTDETKEEKENVHTSESSMGSMILISTLNNQALIPIEVLLRIKNHDIKQYREQIKIDDKENIKNIIQTLRTTITAKGINESALAQECNEDESPKKIYVLSKEKLFPLLKALPPSYHTETTKACFICAAQMIQDDSEKHIFNQKRQIKINLKNGAILLQQGFINPISENLTIAQSNQQLIGLFYFIKDFLSKLDPQKELINVLDQVIEDRVISNDTKFNAYRLLLIISAATGIFFTFWFIKKYFPSSQTNYTL